MLENDAEALEPTAAYRSTNRSARIEFSPDFVDFSVGDLFVDGYEIDRAEQCRHLPCIDTIEFSDPSTPLRRSQA